MIAPELMGHTAGKNLSFTKDVLSTSSLSLNPDSLQKEKVPRRKENLSSFI